MEKLRTSRPILLALTSGLFLGITLLPYDVFPYAHGLLFLAFVPLLLACLGEKSAWRICALGWLAQALLSCIAFPWIAYTLRSFAHAPAWMSYLGLLLFASTAYLFLPAGLLIAAWLFPPERAKPLVRLCGFVLTLGVSELLMPALFPWSIGSAWLYQGGPAYQAADLVGFRGLGFLALTFNGALAAIFLLRGNWKLAPFALAAVVYGAMYEYGAWKIPRLPPADHLFRVLVVQANVGNKQKLLATKGDHYQEEIVKIYASQSLEALRAEKSPPDLVVWAETAYPAFLPLIPIPSPPQEALRAYLREARVPLLTGSFGVNDAGKVTNSVFLLAPGGGAVGGYSKNYLMPFGEAFPLAGIFPSLGRAFGARDFGAGHAPTLFSLGGTKFSPQICYEDLFAELARQDADLGADLLINVTNDSWYGPGSEPLQHLYSGLGRAIETRRPFVRATNTGISSGLLADGSFLPQIPLGAKESKLFEIPYARNPPPTFYQRTGYWLFPWLLSSGWLLLVLISLGTAFRRKPQGQ